jgi:hypothetical protein
MKHSCSFCPKTFEKIEEYKMHYDEKHWVEDY